MATNSNSNNNRVHGEHGATFEQNFARLQEVVGKLSEGNLSLQEALGAFEEGMALADECARMLDEAELRVKHVSDRAMQAGSAQMVEIDEVMRGGAPNRRDQNLVAIEIERYEASVVFDEAPAKGPGARGQGSGIRGQEPSVNSKPQPKPVAQPLLNELDPLFDEED